MAKYELDIHSYKDLLEARKKLKEEVKTMEAELKDNTLLKIGTSLFSKGKGNVYSKPLSFIPSNSALSPSNNVLVSAAESLLGTLLISNKLTRKYFIGYTVAKEMIPFAIKKFNEIFKKKTEYY